MTDTKLYRARTRFYVLRRALSDSLFDWRRGLQTTGDIDPADYPTGRGRDAVRYQPTHAHQLRRIVSRLKIDPRRYTFVDLGAGKGRMVVAAVELGFGRAVGVELSPSLAAIAKDNVLRYCHKYHGKQRGEIVAGDAADFEMPSEPTLVYLFNPFGEETMRAVLARLTDSLANRSAPLLIVYRAHRLPAAEALLAESPRLSLVAREVSRRIGEYTIYEAILRS